MGQRKIYRPAGYAFHRYDTIVATYIVLITDFVVPASDRDWNVTSQLQPLFSKQQDHVHVVPTPTVGAEPAKMDTPTAVAWNGSISA